MKQQFIFLLFMLCCISCVSQKKEVIAKSTIKFEGRNTNITDLIDIDGFFYYPNLPKNENILFFQDGGFIKFLSRKKVSGEKMTIELSDYAEYLENKGQVDLIGYRGVYTIKQDTIIVHIYKPSSLLVAWSLEEEQYKIINKKTIKRLSVRGLLKTDEEYYKESGRSSWIKNEENMHFMPVDSLPSSDSSFKEYKWIWRNESDWKAYMDRIKLEKKKKK